MTEQLEIKTLEVEPTVKSVNFPEYVRIDSPEDITRLVNAVADILRGIRSKSQSTSQMCEIELKNVAAQVFNQMHHEGYRLQKWQEDKSNMTFWGKEYYLFPVKRNGQIELVLTFFLIRMLTLFGIMNQKYLQNSPILDLAVELEGIFCAVKKIGYGFA